MWSTVKSPAGDACVAPTRRRSIRLRDYDYTTGGAYFITMCTRNRECLFGSVIDGNVLLNELGEIAASCWNAITEHFPDVEVDRFVVMPNHIHGILVIHAVGATHASPTPRPPETSRPHPRSLGAIVGSFKSAVAARINQSRRGPRFPVWQRNYYEHVIRSQSELGRIREYVMNNPVEWDLDPENPSNKRPAKPICN